MSDRPVVLLVDDEPAMLAALLRSLRREGLEIETAANAAEALARIDHSPVVDLVISDHRMPGRTGLEMLVEVRRKRPATARILLSGWTAEIPASDLEAAGLAAVHPKPWDAHALKRSIREALGSAT